MLFWEIGYAQSAFPSLSSSPCWDIYHIYAHHFSSANAFSLGMSSFSMSLSLQTHSYTRARLPHMSRFPLTHFPSHFILSQLWFDIFLSLLPLSIFILMRHILHSICYTWWDQSHAHVVKMQEMIESIHIYIVLSLHIHGSKEHIRNIEHHFSIGYRFHSWYMSA